MKDLITQAHQFISGGAGMTITSVIAIWILGKFSTSTAYRRVRGTIGKACEAAGVLVDATLGSKLGRPIWNPIEKVLTDTMGLAVEQFCVGLRKNDVSAMADQHARLTDVGSQDRVAMIAKKMEAAIAQGREIPESDPVVAKVLADSQAWALRQKLENR